VHRSDPVPIVVSMNQRRALLIGAVALCVLTIVLWQVTRPEPVEVVLAEVDRGPVYATVANTRAGTVEACQRARMSTSMGGQIARLPVDEGDRVKAGDILLELWNDDVRAQVTLAERELTAAGARSREICSMSDIARKEANRVLRLREEKVAAVDTVDRAVGESEARAAGCEAARTQTEVAEARLDAARAAMDRTVLRAPFDGIVAELNGEVGEVVTPSPVGVATLPTVDLIDTSCLYVKAPIDEMDAGAIAEGLPAIITLDAFDDQRYAGQVRRVAPYVLDLAKQARTVDIEAAFLDEEEIKSFLVGYSADVEIILDSRESVPRVPTEALLEGHRVIVFDDGVLEERVIEAGLENWEYTEVIKGLEVGDRVVLTVDRDGVRDGAEAIIEERAASRE
jgi:HlyD family secretion protein